MNGLKLAQQGAILRYVAAHVGLGPSGKPEEDVVADMLGCAVEDLASAYTKCIYSPEAVSWLFLDFFSAFTSGRETTLS